MDTLDSPQTSRQTAPLPAPLRLQITALGGIGLVRPGDDLARIIMDAVAATGETLSARITQCQPGDTVISYLCVAFLPGGLALSPGSRLWVNPSP